jgi:hypothetical protein
MIIRIRRLLFTSLVYNVQRYGFVAAESRQRASPAKPGRPHYCNFHKRVLLALTGRQLDAWLGSIAYQL